MNGDKHVNQLVLSAKIGNEKDFKVLWQSHKFLLDQIYLKFCDLYPMLSRRRVEVYHFMYSWFWEAIDKHDFKKNEPFCYILKEKIIDKMFLYLKEDCLIPQELIVNREEFKRNLKKDNLLKNKKLYYALRSLTVKQLQAIFYHMYEENKLEDCARKIGISQRSLRDRLEMSYKKISGIVFGIKTKNKKKIFAEKSYSLPR